MLPLACPSPFQPPSPSRARTQRLYLGCRLIFLRRRWRPQSSPGGPTGVRGGVPGRKFAPLPRESGWLPIAGQRQHADGQANQTEDLRRTDTKPALPADGRRGRRRCTRRPSAGGAHLQAAVPGCRGSHGRRAESPTDEPGPAEPAEPRDEGPTATRPRVPRAAAKSRFIFLCSTHNPHPGDQRAYGAAAAAAPPRLFQMISLFMSGRGYLPSPSPRTHSMPEPAAARQRPRSC